MSVAASGGVFISYRRQETSDIAGRLYERLAAHDRAVVTHTTRRSAASASAVLRVSRPP